MKRWKTYMESMKNLGAGPLTLTASLTLSFLANLTFTVVGLAQF